MPSNHENSFRTTRVAAEFAEMIDAEIAVKELEIRMDGMVSRK